MSLVDIPMLRASAVFAARLIEAARQYGDVKYQFHRRVNWSQRFDQTFHVRETDCFVADPDAYLAQQQPVAPQVVDVFAQMLRPKQVAVAVLKVLAHWLFDTLGSVANRGIRMSGTTTYRKCYVDDIELVFAPDEAGVVRAVYPFPLNIRRQWRYLQFLRRKGYRFKLAGNPYLATDLLRLLWRRDVRALQRLESRAQVRHARQLTALGIKTAQLSDEFDIGSLDFARTLAHLSVHVVNSAHGVGKYFPMHAYQEFHVITERQAQYYHAVRPCTYTLRTLNDRAALPVSGVALADTPGVQLVFLSQVFEGVTDVVASNEAIVMTRLKAEFAGSPHISLLYRPHPNSHQPVVPQGFKLLSGLDEVNGHPGTVFASFYSTCQIDPAFKGKKVLVRGHLIYPEIVFDEAETILDADELVAFVCEQIRLHQNLPVQRSPNTAIDYADGRRPDIPLLNESSAFATRLIEAARQYGDVKYQFHRRVNWSQRFDQTFHVRETDCFVADPDAYLAQQQPVAPQVVDVFAQMLRPKQVAVAVLKVLAHWLFDTLGSVANRGIRMSGTTTYRKCYVDDIELVFAPDEAGVVRAVYPFPLNIRRQWRYLQFLRRKGYRFKLAGNPYLATDLLRLLWRRDVRALQRLESRAQVRHARQLTALGIKTAQLSDEFDIGSLDFARTLAHLSVHVVNSAHGVGKYFPMHAYQEFHVITERQAQYYHAVRPCTYTLRTLNDVRVDDATHTWQLTEVAPVQLVWLSQIFAAVGQVIATEEAEVIGELRADLYGHNGITLYYKPHPNNHSAIIPPGFLRITNLGEVNGQRGTVFASFFSTCQIDPAFKGQKVLVSGRWIFPRIAFDDSEPLFTANGLVRYVKQLATNPSLGDSK